MNIKTILLGTAAALLAVSGARAADAVEVAAEPEAMEYVRVCDTYGTGYFYIPGTETCLRIGGYVRVDIGAGNGPYGGHIENDRLNNPTDIAAGDHNDTYHHQVRFALRTYTGTETELGTLKTFTETRFHYADGAENSHDDGYYATMPFAWIQLGGFRVGKDESAFIVFSGNAGSVIADDVVNYGTRDTNLISYTFDAGNGFSAILSLETGSRTSTANYEIDSYVPHVVGGVKYAGDWGSAVLVGAYDSAYEEFAIKGRVDVKVNDQFSLFVMGAYGTDDRTDMYKRWSGDWAVWGGASYKFSDKATVNAQVAYTDANSVTGADDQLAIAANVAYTVVPGFKITPEVTYTDRGGVDAPGSDGFGGWLRFQRDF